MTNELQATKEERARQSLETTTSTALTRAQTAGERELLFEQFAEKSIKSVSQNASPEVVQEMKAMLASFKRTEKWLGPDDCNDVSVALLPIFLPKILAEKKHLVKKMKKEGVTKDLLKEIENACRQTAEEVLKGRSKRVVNSAAASLIVPMFMLLAHAAIFKGDKLVDILPKLPKTKYPSQYLMSNNAVLNTLLSTKRKKWKEVPKETLPDAISSTGAVHLCKLIKNLGKNRKNPKMYTIVSFKDNVSFEGPIFESFDRCVFNAVCSLYEAGNAVMTVDMIDRAMSNKKDTEYTSPERDLAIRQSMARMRNIIVYADLSEEARVRKIKDEETGKVFTDLKINSPVLMFEGVTVATGGQEVNAFEIVKKPALLRYSQLNNEIISINSKILDIKETKIETCFISSKSISNTKTRQSIKEYLIRRIERASYEYRKAKNRLEKYQKQRSRNKSLPEKTEYDFMIVNCKRILIDSILEEASNDEKYVGQPATAEAVKKLRKRTIDYAKQCLDYWTLAGYVAGYDIVPGTRKNSIHAFDIRFTDTEVEVAL